MSLCTLLFEASGNMLFCGDSSISESLSFQWNPAFVLLSVCICIIYSGIACDMYSKTSLSENTLQAAILKTGIIYGMGIFSMHFIGMYALTSPGPMFYDAYITAFSLWLAVSGTSLTLLLLYKKYSLVLAATTFGLTVCSMHYSGMLSLYANPYHMHHDIGLLIVAVLYSVSGSYFALSTFQRYLKGHNKRALIISAITMGVTISGMHYLAMAEMEFTVEVFPSSMADSTLLSREDVIWSTLVLLLITITIYINDSINSEHKLTFKKKELELSNKSISSSLSKLKSMQNQLIESEKNASMGQLISGVAHEINTPIGICITSASYLSEQSDSFFDRFQKNELTKHDFENYIDTHQTSTSLINENLKKASELIAVFKQVSVDQNLDSPRRFHIGHFINELLSSLNHKIKIKSVDARLEIEEDFEIFTYAGSLIIILTHLINNSLLHAFDNIDEGKILLKVATEGDNVLLEYSDNGCGMNNEDCKKMLSPFYTTKRNQGSCGLGMNIVYNQTNQKLQGQLSSVSHLGEGVCINLVFPKEISNPEHATQENK